MLHSRPSSVFAIYDGCSQWTMCSDKILCLFEQIRCQNSDLVKPSQSGWMFRRSTILRWHHAFVDGRFGSTDSAWRATHHSDVTNQCEYGQRCDRRRPLPEHKKNYRILEYDAVIRKPNFVPASSNAENVVDIGSASLNPWANGYSPPPV